MSQVQKPQNQKADLDFSDQDIEKELIPVTDQFLKFCFPAYRNFQSDATLAKIVRLQRLMKGVEKEDIRGQVKFIGNLFGIAA